MFFKGKELRPIDGDGAEFKRNSVGGGVDGQGVTGNGYDGAGCDWLSCKESRLLQSDNQLRPSWQLLGNFNVSGFI